MDLDTGDLDAGSHNGGRPPQRARTRRLTISAAAAAYQCEAQRTGQLDPSRGLRQWEQDDDLERSRRSACNADRHIALDFPCAVVIAAYSPLLAIGPAPSETS